MGQLIEVIFDQIPVVLDTIERTTVLLENANSAMVVVRKVLKI